MNEKTQYWLEIELNLALSKERYATFLLDSAQDKSGFVADILKTGLIIYKA